MKCVMATDGTFYIPGQNQHCPGRGDKRPPSQIARWFSGNICKEHEAYFSDPAILQVWADAFSKQRSPIDGQALPYNADRNQFAAQASEADAMEKFEKYELLKKERLKALGKAA